MAKPFRITFTHRMSNLLMTTLVRAGVPLGNISLLTIPGRKSGKPRTTPVLVRDYNGKRYLVAVYAVGDWVRNLRAAGSATLTRGRRSETIGVVELSPEEGAPILKADLNKAGASMILPYFDAKPESSLQEFAREAERHPVFQLRE